MIDADPGELSLVRQCALLGVSRSAWDHQPKPLDSQDLELMRLIDEPYLKTPFYGSRKRRKHLRRLGYRVNRKRVQRLMRVMGLEAIYPKPKASVAHPEHQVYPYLLREVAITRPNQVWATDITYVPLARGFMDLVASLDWASRQGLAWRVSHSLDSSFGVEALQEALARYGKPEIFNTDQGSPFTSEAFTTVLQTQGIRISMDGRGRCHDHIFIERLWRTVKYEFLYLHAFDSGGDLRRGLKTWLEWYNPHRPHQGLGYQTPDEVYFQLNTTVTEAA
jgi:putative transposase